MKNLTANFEILSNEQIKNIKGGAAFECADGEKLYKCTLSLDGIQTAPGYICGTDETHLGQKMEDIYGKLFDVIEVRCN